MKKTLDINKFGMSPQNKESKYYHVGDALAKVLTKIHLKFLGVYMILKMILK